MKIAILLDIVRRLGPKLPEAWPHVLIIASELKILIGILAEDQLFGAEGEEFVSLCAANGVSEEQAREALAL